MSDRRELMLATLHSTVLKLRHDGYSVEEVAQQVGISPLRCHAILEAALAELNSDSQNYAEDIRALELARLETATKGVMPRVATGDPGAINSLIKIQNRRAAYLGLDNPKLNPKTVIIDMPWIQPGRLAYKQEMEDVVVKEPKE